MGKVIVIAGSGVDASRITEAIENIKDNDISADVIVISPGEANELGYFLPKPLSELRDEVFELQCLDPPPEMFFEKPSHKPNHFTPKRGKRKGYHK